MTPYEIMLSESQERMLVVPKAGRENEVEEVLTRWGLEATVIGRVTGDGQLRLLEDGKIVAEIPVIALTEEAPVYQRPAAEPAYYQELKSKCFDSLVLNHSVEEVFLGLLSNPTIASKEWVYRQYDHQVGTNTVVLPGGDAAVLRVRGTKKGIALTTDCNSRYVYLDPYLGGALAVVEAAQNIACVGAQPLAITDCLNFGNPEKPEIFWEFEQACAGVAEACRVLGTPVTGGNVSLYNETSVTAIFPTPMIGMVGLIEDLSQVLGNKFQAEGEQIYLLGELEGELSGSEYLAVFEKQEAGKLPELDLQEIKRRIDFLLELNKEGLLLSAHDVSEGGLAVALAEMTVKYGAVINIEAGNLLKTLFGERLGRIIISASAGNAPRLEMLAKASGIPLTYLGASGSNSFKVTINGTCCLHVAQAVYRPLYEQALAQIMNSNI
jgi:phosphoribosylformylglycinamidine synthase